MSTGIFRLACAHWKARFSAPLSLQPQVSYTGHLERMRESKISGHRWHPGWDSQLSLWTLVTEIFYPFSREDCHGLVEYRVCSSQPDPWSFVRSRSSEFGLSEAKAGLKSQSLTSCSFQSIEHCTWLWLHLFLPSLPSPPSLPSSPCWSAHHQVLACSESPSWRFTYRDLDESASLPIGSYWPCTTIYFYLSIQEDTKIPSGINDF